MLNEEATARDYRGAQVTDRPSTPLDQLENLADRAERCIHLIDQFIGRFRGASDGKAGGPAAVPSGHQGQLSRLDGALNHLESLAQTLSEIG